MKRKINERANIIDYVVEMSVRRNGYSRQQVMGRSCTVGDLIDKLETFDRDTKIITEHDGGYTFGTVYTRDIDEVPVEEDVDESLKKHSKTLKENKYSNGSVHTMLWELENALYHLVDGFEGDNQDGIDLNELEANEYYPFDKSLDEVLNDVRTWKDEVEEEVERKMSTKVESLKKSKKLHETFKGESLKEGFPTDDELMAEIKRNNEEGIKNGSAKEFSDILFDTIMGNTRYPNINPDLIDDAEDNEVDSNAHWMTINYGGHKYKINVELVESRKSSKGRKLTEDEEKIIVHELPDDAYGQDYWDWLIDDDGLYGKDGKNGLIILYDDGRNILKNYTQFSDEELKDVIYEDGAEGLSELIGKEYAEFDIGYYPVGEFSDEWLSELSDVAKGDYTVYEVQNNEDGKYETLIGDTVLTTISKRGSDEEQIAEILGVSPEQIVIKKPRHTYVYDFYQQTKGRKLNETFKGEDIISDLVDRAKSYVDDDNDVDDAVRQAIDDGLIYTEDIVDLAVHYGTVGSELIDSFYEDLYNDVYSETSDYYDETHENEEQEESFKLTRGKRLKEARKKEKDFDFDKVTFEIEDLKELYAEDGLDGVVDLSWENIKYNYPEFAKVFEYFSDYIYDDTVSVKDSWEYMDEPLYKSVMEYIDTKGKNNPINLIKKNDPSLKVVLTSNPDPKPEEEIDEFEADDDFIYDLGDFEDDLSAEEKETMKAIGNSVRDSNRK